MSFVPEPRPLTEYDCRAPALQRNLDANQRALPAARRRAHALVEAGRAANPDLTTSASAAYGLCEAAITADQQLLAGLDRERPMWFTCGGPRILGRDLPRMPVLIRGDRIVCRDEETEYELAISLISTMRPVKAHELRPYIRFELVRARDQQCVGSCYLCTGA
jgi:hypothetical protein